MKKIIALLLTTILCLSLLTACGKSKLESALKDIEDAAKGFSDDLDTLGQDNDTDVPDTDEDDGDDDVNVSDAYGIGDTAEYDNQKMTLVSVEEWTGWKEYYGPEEGNKVLKAYFSFENNQDDEEYVSSYDFTCHADGKEASGYYFGDDDEISGTADPNGGKIEGAMYFEVPEDAKTVTVDYEFNFFYDDGTVTFVLQ